MILHVLWKEKISNEKISTQQQKEENIIRQRTMRYTEHVLRMKQESITKAVVRWIPPNGKRKPGRSKIDKTQTVTEDIKRGGVS